MCFNDATSQAPIENTDLRELRRTGKHKTLEKKEKKSCGISAVFQGGEASDRYSGYRVREVASDEQ